MYENVGHAPNMHGINDNDNVRMLDTLMRGSYNGLDALINAKMQLHSHIMHLYQLVHSLMNILIHL